MISRELLGSKRTISLQLLRKVCSGGVRKKYWRRQGKKMRWVTLNLHPRWINFLRKKNKEKRQRSLKKLQPTRNLKFYFKNRPTSLKIKTKTRNKVHGILSNKQQTTFSTWQKGHSQSMQLYCLPNPITVEISKVTIWTCLMMTWKPISLISSIISSSRSPRKTISL